MDGSSFPACGQCRSQSVEESFFEGGRIAVGVSGQQRCYHPFVGEEIACGNGLIALGVGMYTETVRSRVHRGVPADVDDGQLSVIGELLMCQCGFPSASESSTRGPRDGLVTFCEATTPTPARGCAQRAATAGLDEQITMPNAPEAGSRATSENVIRRRPSAR